ncbi:hypothetical protein HYN48_10700 [Flavobacterium magnum]|uniref:Secretion system C-terminal sorting domain-containing protein n=1 Tax=Flavobacterium magnum TaxID=2162713 RepID=A0A2S0RIG7_9FLAO|nr:T9SS type A sorting domain-containing protein [Flavobacterium magnum]AWA30522.1 hypothetical protein HYN48_10700 [Flavobacterium magnum]
MKQLHFVVAAATMLCHTALAQPQITRSNVNTTNFESEFYYAPADGLDVGEAGIEQVWDFSSLDLMYLGTDVTLPVSATPYAATFPTANYCYKYDGIFGQTGRYYYHTITPSKYEILSIAWNGTAGDNYNPDPRTFMVFPYNLNDSYTDTYKSTDDMVEKNVVATYDAYGTVIMPFGTLNNVIRQKVVTDGVTDYIWFNVEPFYPIVQTVFAENSLGIVKNTTPLGIENPAERTFSIAPNPTSGAFSIASEGFSDGSEISINNALGQSVAVQKIAAMSETVTLNIQDQPAGLYFAIITDKQTSVKHTQKIIKQ